MAASGILWAFLPLLIHVQSLLARVSFTLFLMSHLHKDSFPKQNFSFRTEFLTCLGYEESWKLEQHLYIQKMVHFPWSPSWAVNTKVLLLTQRERSRLIASAILRVTWYHDFSGSLPPCFCFMRSRECDSEERVVIVRTGKVKTMDVSWARTRWKCMLKRKAEEVYQS